MNHTEVMRCPHDRNVPCTKCPDCGTYCMDPVDYCVHGYEGYCPICTRIANEQFPETETCDE